MHLRQSTVHSVDSSTCCISWNVPQRSVKPCQVAAKEICSEIWLSLQVPRCAQLRVRACAQKEFSATARIHMRYSSALFLRRVFPKHARKIKVIMPKLNRQYTIICSAVQPVRHFNTWLSNSEKAAFTPFCDSCRGRATYAVFGRNVELFTISSSTR